MKTKHLRLMQRVYIILFFCFMYLPIAYMILPLYTSMTKIDQSLVEAAQDLGANTTKTLVRVLIPMSVPGISTGITMVFVPAVSTFVISRMLGGCLLYTSRCV